MQKAPFEPVNAALALREFTDERPNGENDYLDTLRAYSSTLYERILAPQAGTYFLEKTPAHGLFSRFVAKRYPIGRLTA